ncbi:hypothetical protein [Phytohabitans aurantiacus]|uniref:Secreted protein n=1 Tax=Phytohabitans aurantiacus TaxID=3016789 RepID=A0ABQ5R641_9ACTN|nr:hypothetical protein [Phytohabitans aurantiacus]GLI01855.1 hypothetical protein Pa4123_71320 [Phytohabitans aurantiacus]
MNRWFVKAVVALATAAAVAVTATPAVAEEPVWERVECLTGTLDETQVVQETYDLAQVALSGSLDCGASGKARFGFARYDSRTYNGLVYEPYMRAYAYTAPSPFSISKYVEYGPVDFALCVVTDYDVRIGCVRLTREDWDRKLYAFPIKTDDPMVDRPVRVVPWDGSERPVCGHCW